jgi:hypothetical protein
MGSFQLNTPVVFLIFNRPAATQLVFDKIRRARPSMLLVVADGPRAERPEEAEKCKKVRAIIDEVDWPCEVLKNYSDTNLGCKQRVASGLDWVFQTVEEAIILEDDCLPDPSFFPFCADLLERFRNDNRVFIVSGMNDLGTWKADQYSYFFTLGNTWGWATWKRAWQHFDLDLKLWTDEIAQQRMKVFGQHASYLTEDIAAGCRAVLREKLDTWDYQWAFDRIMHSGLGVVPAMNLVSNIGFGKNATHTNTHDSTYADKPVYTMQFPLKHNPDMRVDFEFYEQCHKAKAIPMLRRVKNRLKSYYRRLRNLIYLN